jgi:hypothetical protein
MEKSKDSTEGKIPDFLLQGSCSAGPCFEMRASVDLQLLLAHVDGFYQYAVPLSAKLSL